MISNNFQVIVTSGSSNLLEERRDFDNLSEALSFAESVNEWSHATIVAFDKRMGHMSPILRRTAKYMMPEGFGLADRKPKLIPLFGRYN